MSALEALISGVTRTLAHCKDITVSLGSGTPMLDHVRSELLPSSDDVRIPAPSSPDPTAQLEASRGFADSAGFLARYHARDVHQRFAPSLDPETRTAFDALERARCDCVGGLSFRGCEANIAQNFEARCALYESEHSSALPPLPEAEAVRMAGFYRFTGRPCPPCVANAIDLSCPQWMKEIDWRALQGILSDQVSFSKASLSALQEAGLPFPDTHEPPDTESTKPAETNADDDAAAAQESPSSHTDQNTPSDPPAPSQETDTQVDGDTDETHTQQGADDGGRMGENASGSHPSGRPSLEDKRLYHIYCSDYDEIVDAADLSDPFELRRLRAMLDAQLEGTRALIGRLAARLQRTIMAQQERQWRFDQEEGVLDASRLARIVANPTVPLTFKQETQNDERDTVVTLLIDNSGSMRGRPIALAAMSADVIAQTLERCNICVEILGFTTRAWKGGKSREHWVSQGQPPEPGRLNDIRHIIYKSADMPMRRARKNLGLMLKEGILKENIDGEGLAWAHNRLARRPEVRKILLVISDGAPVDDSTLASNTGNLLEADLRTVIDWVETHTAIELRAIGIGHDVTRYYSRAITLSDASNLAETLIDQLADLFTPK